MFGDNVSQWQRRSTYSVVEVRTQTPLNNHSKQPNNNHLCRINEESEIPHSDCIDGYRDGYGDVYRNGNGDDDDIDAVRRFDDEEEGSFDLDDQQEFAMAQPTK